MPEPYRPDLATDGARALDWLRLVRSDMRWLYAFVAGAWVLGVLAVVLGIEATNAPTTPWQPRARVVTSRRLGERFAPGEPRVVAATISHDAPPQLQLPPLKPSSWAGPIPSGYAVSPAVRADGTVVWGLVKKDDP